MQSDSAALSPFHSRAYGGFTRGQEDFFRSQLGKPSGQTILDPMAGQGHCISALAREGAKVWLGDIDPAPLLLASLRDPRLIANAAEHCDWFRSVIATLARRRRKRSKTHRFFAGWVTPSISSDLRELGEIIGLGLYSNPFSPKSSFWTTDSRARFATAIVMLAARELACFRATDNLTWLKPGGLVRAARAVDPLRVALNRWADYASDHTSASTKPSGLVAARLMDAQRGHFADSRKVSWIITSPPYANRLDYSRLWGPELNVLAVIAGGSVERIKADQLGSTVVEGTSATAGLEAALPKVVRAALKDIRNDPTEFSADYYYPFFRNYAVGLSRTLQHLALRLRPDGTLILFVRDTVRKNVLFPTGALVRGTLTSSRCGLRETVVERRVIGSHIGFLRKSSARGLFGLAQQEWWLVFRKPRSYSTNGSSR
jgi:hypothetical protein